MEIFKNNQYLLYAFLIIIVFQFYLIFNLKGDLTKIKCDLVSSINAEREYSYPILRMIDYAELRAIDYSDDYGKNVKNPIISDKFYSCEE